MSDSAVTRSRIGSMTYLAPNMALVAADAIAALDSAITACIAQHQVTIVVDLGKVALLSGRALESMVHSAARLAALGGWLKLACCSTY
jgi:type IV pilus assembly protein PilB